MVYHEILVEMPHTFDITGTLLTAHSSVLVSPSFVERQTRKIQTNYRISRCELSLQCSHHLPLVSGQDRPVLSSGQTEGCDNVVFTTSYLN